MPRGIQDLAVRVRPLAESLEGLRVKRVEAAPTLTRIPDQTGLTKDAEMLRDRWLRYFERPREIWKGAFPPSE